MLKTNEYSMHTFSFTCNLFVFYAVSTNIYTQLLVNYWFQFIRKDCFVFNKRNRLICDLVVLEYKAPIKVRHDPYSII